MNTAFDVACYIIEKSKYTKTHLQVQKLVYISHGFMLAVHDRPLFSEDVEAWSHGPAIPSIYEAFKGRGSGIIDDSVACTPKQFDDDERKVIGSVCENYDKFTGYHLSELTRNAGGGLDTPWMQCFVSGKENAVISNDLIQKYYKLLLKVDVQ